MQVIQVKNNMLTCFANVSRINSCKCFAFGNVDRFVHTVKDVNAPMVFIVKCHKATVSANVELKMLVFVH